MFDNNISFNSLLTSMEGTLMIEMSGDMKVADIVDAAIARLENKYACKLDRDVFSLQSEGQLMADNIELFLRDVQHCLMSMSFYGNLKMFHANMAIMLADVNYLGYAKKQLLTALRYLMYETEYKKHADNIIKPLYTSLDNIDMCSIKRLFINILILHKLGISEGVSIIAQILYLGGLVA